MLWQFESSLLCWKIENEMETKNGVRSKMNAVCHHVKVALWGARHLYSRVCGEAKEAEVSEAWAESEGCGAEVEAEVRRMR
jgi:hypothetical protein